MQVTSTEGDSASGQTPNIVWKNFQKKTGAKVKNWQRRKSFPQKIDGAEACFYTSTTSQLHIASKIVGQGSFFVPRRQYCGW